MSIPNLYHSTFRMNHIFLIMPLSGNDMQKYAFRTEYKDFAATCSGVGDPGKCARRYEAVKNRRAEYII